MSVRDWFRRRRPMPPMPPMPSGTVEDRLFEALKRAGLLPPDATIEGMSVVDHRHGPPVADPDLQPWPVWQKAMEQMHVEGWAPCSFAVRVWLNGIQGPEAAMFRYGIAKGHFGVFSMDMGVCDMEDDTAEKASLASLAHLPSGGVMGVFASPKLACFAVDTMLAAMDVPWGSLIENPLGDKRWHEAQQKAHTAWAFNGLGREAHRHAHPFPGAPELSIWNVSPVAEAAKPRNLS